MDYILQTKIQELDSEKQNLFFHQYNSHKKIFTVALLLCLFLGGLGAHKFYLGKSGQGITYLLFFWTSIPALLALINLFTLSSEVTKINNNEALKMLAYIK